MKYTPVSGYVDTFVCEDCSAIIKRGFNYVLFEYAFCENCYRVYIFDDVDKKWIRCRWTLFRDSDDTEYPDTHWIYNFVKELTSYDEATTPYI